MLTGRCWCGNCTYTVNGEGSTDVAICHCELCRRTTGGTHVTWMTVALNDFRWTANSPAEVHATEHGTRYFCPHCGTHLALFTTKAASTIDITVCSLDTPEQHAPNRHIYISSQLPWVALGDLPLDEYEAGVNDT